MRPGRPGLVTLVPVVENVATSALTSVPNGTLPEIELPMITADPSAVSPGFFAARKPNATISLACDTGGGESVGSSLQPVNAICMRRESPESVQVAQRR